MIDFQPNRVQTEIGTARAKLLLIIDQLVELRVRDADVLDNIFRHRIPR